MAEEKVTEYCHEFVHQLMMYFFGEKIRSLALAKTKNKDKHSFILQFKGKQDLAMVLVMEKVLEFLQFNPLSNFVDHCEKWFAVPSPLMYDINKSFEAEKKKIFPFKFPTPGMYLHPNPPFFTIMPLTLFCSCVCKRDIAISGVNNAACHPGQPSQSQIHWLRSLHAKLSMITCINRQAKS